MKKIRLFSLTLSVILALGLFLIPVKAEDAPAVQLGCSSLQAGLPLGGSEQLLPTADAVILYELNTKTMVYAYHPDDRLNPSSMVKIMAALVALESGDLEDVVTVRRETLDSIPIGTVSAGLRRDEKVTLKDLLYCCVVGSANDATAVLAEHIAGSQAAFVDLMNEKARSLGCRDTFFSNVNGLNDDMQYSTARDLAIITEEALQNAAFIQMFCADQYTMPATNLSDERIIYTTNYMTSDIKVKGYTDDRVTGGKTAAATQTKRSLICTAQIGTARYLSVVMSADSVMSEDKISVVSFGSFLETAKLLDYAENTYEVRQILESTQTYSRHPVQGGENDVTLAPREDVFTVLPLTYEPGTLQFTPTIHTGALTAPLQTGTAVGSIRVTYQGVVLAETELAAMFSVAKKDSVIRPAPPAPKDEQQIRNENLMKWILVAVVGALVIAAVVLLGIRLARNARIRSMHRKRKRNRRRSR